MEHVTSVHSTNSARLQSGSVRDFLSSRRNSARSNLPQPRRSSVRHPAAPLQRSCWTAKARGRVIATRAYGSAQRHRLLQSFGAAVCPRSTRWALPRPRTASKGTLDAQERHGGRFAAPAATTSHRRAEWQGGGGGGGLASTRSNVWQTVCLGNLKVQPGQVAAVRSRR